MHTTKAGERFRGSLSPPAELRGDEEGEEGERGPPGTRKDGGLKLRSPDGNRMKVRLSACKPRRVAPRRQTAEQIK